MVDANSGSVLHATNADALRHPASLTKIMTLYLLFEQIEAGKLRLDSRLEVSEHASQQAPSKLGLLPGQTISVEDAIRALVTKSANDAAVVVAEAIGGDEETFARMMTRKARALGMSRTVYANASGLPDEDQLTTARDQVDARPRHPGPLPALLPLFRDAELHLSRPRDAQPQQAARPRRGRRRHQDRLHPRLRLQSGVVGAARQSPHRRRGARRRVRRARATRACAA